MIGTKLLARYELTDEIGHGGMGVVYRARDPLLDREVAVKMLPPGFLRPDTEKRFRHEARVVAQMDHPAIVPIYDFGYHDGSLFLVMPVVAGATLRSSLRDGSLRLGEVLEIAVQVADALDYSHALGIIHRDIKPENIMVARERGALRVRVMDFGLARDTSTTGLTQGSGILGTVTYMSPEQVSAEPLDGRTDLYSLGVVVYECLVGEPPFVGSVHSVVLSIARDHPRSPRARSVEVSEELDELVMACLAREPSARPPSGKDLAQALQRCAAQLDDGALRRSVLLTTKLGRRERPRSTLIGRKAELRELHRRLDAALDGECQLALLEGDAGIGKSRLLEELATLARARGIRVLQGRFADRRSALPYQGFCELVQDYFRSKETTTASSGVANLSDLAPELLALFPMFSEIEELRTTSSAHEAKPPPDAPAAAGLRHADAVYVFELLARTLTRLAGGKPLVLVLETLHAADASVEALGYLVRRLGPTPTLIAGAYRPNEIDRAHPLHQLLESLSDDPRCSRIELGPLSRKELRQLVEAEVGEGELDDDSFESLYESSEGNPLFARELITSLREGAGLRRDTSGVWVLEGRRGIVGEALPKTIQQAIRKRLDRLPEAQRKVLSVAAVLGRSFDYEDLEALADDDGIEEVIDALMADGLLEEERRRRGDRLSFTSGVVHDVVYHELPRRRRRALHRRHAYQLEKRHGGRLERVHPRLVYHFSEGDVADKTVTYGLELARRSLEAMNPEEAMRSSKTALEFVDEEDVEDPVSVRGELLLVLARAERTARHFDSALANAEKAAATFARAEKPAAAAAAALLAAETAWQARQGGETRRWVERGSELARSSGARETLKKLLTLGATVANLRGEHREARQYLDEAERLAPTPGEPSAEEPVPDGGTLVTALPATVMSLDPAAVLGDEEIEIAANVFETLLATADGHPEGSLSSAWTSSADGSKFAVTLHPDVRFSDGRALRAAEVKASLERAAGLAKADPPTALAAVEGLAAFLAGEADEISGIDVSGDRELVFRLVEPLPVFPSLLTNLWTAVVREVAAGEDRTLLGTGPFRIAETSSDRIVLERNPNYWRGSPAHLERLEFRTAVDASAIAAGLRAGEIDLGRDLYPQDLEELLRDSRFRSGLVEATKKNVYFVLFHLAGPLAHKQEVRRALAGVVRAHDLVWRTLGRFAQPAAGLIPPGMLGHDPGRRRQTLSRERASELLRTAGLGPPLRVRAAIHPLLQDRYGALTRGLLREWQALGCEIETTGSSMAQFRHAYLENRDIDLLLGRWISDHGDPDDFTYGFFHSRSGQFRRYFASAEADRLVERARREARPAVRAGLYQELEELLDHESVVVPLFHDVDYRIAGPQVRGLRLTSTPPYVSYATAGKAAPATGREHAAAPSRAPRRGGEIHVPLPGPVRTLDPTLGLWAEYVETIPNVFEPLTRVEQGARIVPWLAAAYEARAGGRRYRFRLREDVRFHDGRRLTARDVRYSFERLLATPKPESHFVLLPIRGARALRDGEAGELSGFRILSATEFEIELEQPMSFFPALLTSPLAVIVPEGCESFVDPWRAGCAGTGPFRVLRLDPGERLELERNPDYRRCGYPKSDRLIFHCGISPEKILEEFRLGRLSLASDLDPADVEVLRRDPELAGGYRESPRLATYFLILNAHHGHFADPVRRRAFARDLEISRSLYEAAGPLVIPAHGIIPPGLLGYEADKRARERVPQIDKTVCSVRLRALHHPVFAGQYALFWERLCEAAGEAGLEIESECGSPAEVLRLAREAKADLVAYRWVADYPDTDGFIGNLLHSGEGSLAGIASAPEIDRLIERGRSETDPALRHIIYREIEETLEREALLIPLFHEQIYRFCHPGVRGFRFGVSTPEVLYEELHVKH
ncbi:MAG: protein kinase [bacterium]|nr:protein kinase [bacterium]